MDQNIYTLLFTNECVHDMERARLKAATMCKGNEGLWSGIHLTNPQGEVITFDPF